MKIIALILLSLFIYGKESFIIEKKITGKDNQNITAKVTMSLDQNIDDIFKKILDFKKYEKIMDEVNGVDIYFMSKETINIKMTVNIFFIDISNHFTHQINHKDYIIKWTLDNTKDNILEYTNGSWILKKISENKTIVIYQNEIETPRYIPLFLTEYLFSDGVINASTWLIEK